MGGTTAKACIVDDGLPVLTTEYEFRDGISAPSRFIKGGGYMLKVPAVDLAEVGAGGRSEEHTSELQSLMRISYAVFCLKKKKNNNIFLPTTKHQQQQNAH